MRGEEPSARMSSMKREIMKPFHVTVGSVGWKLKMLSKIFAITIIGYLTIIPRARMGSESIAHEAEGRRPNRLLTQRP